MLNQNKTEFAELTRMPTRLYDAKSAEVLRTRRGRKAYLDGWAGDQGRKGSASLSWARQASASKWIQTKKWRRHPERNDRCKERRATPRGILYNNDLLHNAMTQLIVFRKSSTINLCVDWLRSFAIAFFVPCNVGRAQDDDIVCLSRFRVFCVFYVFSAW